MVLIYWIIGILGVFVLFGALLTIETKLDQILYALRIEHMSSENLWNDFNESK